LSHTVISRKSMRCSLNQPQLLRPRRRRRMNGSPSSRCCLAPHHIETPFLFSLLSPSPLSSRKHLASLVATFLPSTPIKLGHLLTPPRIPIKRLDKSPCFQHRCLHRSAGTRAFHSLQLARPRLMQTDDDWLSGIAAAANKGPIHAQCRGLCAFLSWNCRFRQLDGGGCGRRCTAGGRSDARGR